jgi:hypothetical protein
VRPGHGRGDDRRGRQRRRVFTRGTHGSSRTVGHVELK